MAEKFHRATFTRNFLKTITRIKNPTINDYERVNKRYLPAYNKIQSKIEELRKEQENVRY